MKTSTRGLIKKTSPRVKIGGNVSKPVSKDELASVIAALTRRNFVRDFVLMEDAERQSIFDFETLNSALSGMNEASQVRVINSFSEELERCKAKLHEAVKARDLEALAETSHHLKGAAGLVGAKKILLASKKLEWFWN